MTEKFSFDLDESARAARSILEDHISATLKHWDKNVARYRSAKANLIEALDAKTGRISVALPRSVPTPGEANTILQTACQYFGFVDFWGGLSSDQAAEDCISPRGIPLCERIDGIKPGMKLGRAFAAYVTHISGGQPFSYFCRKPWAQELVRRFQTNLRRKEKEVRDPTDREFVDLVTDEFARRRAMGKEGTLVLSANLLDLLLMSMHAAFKTCHRLEGEHQAGPQQYLYDGHTAIAYYYQEHRPYDDKPSLNMPYKTWRQLVHIDLKGQYASLMRPYPQKIAPPAQEALVKLIAKVIDGANGLPTDDPDWTAAKYHTSSHAIHPINCDPTTGSGMTAANGNAATYVDVIGTIGLRILRECRHHAGFTLADRPPCFSCGAPITKSGLLTCPRCVHIGQCPQCSRPTRGRTTVVSPDGEEICTDCFAKNYNHCKDCHILGFVGRMYFVPDGCFVCNNCFRKDYFQCSFCSVSSKRGDDQFQKTDNARHCCPGCFAKYYPACIFCKKTTSSAKMANTNEGKCCGDCYAANFFNCEFCGNICKKTCKVEVTDKKAVCNACAVAIYIKCHVCERMAPRTIQSVKLTPNLGHQGTCKRCRMKGAAEEAKKAQESLAKAQTTSVLWQVSTTTDTGINPEF